MVDPVTESDVLAIETLDMESSNLGMAFAIQILGEWPVECPPEGSRGSLEYGEVERVQVFDADDP